jgi:hypothetical protein
MKSKSFTSKKNIDFTSQFKNLSNAEMINIRGGEVPPIPKPTGSDYPIDPLK